MNEKYPNYRVKYECWLNVGKAALICQRTMNALLSEYEITIAQHELLLKLHQYKGIKQNELAAKLFVVKSNVSNHVKRIEKRGLVKTIQCEKDQRAKILVLTKLGEELIERSSEIQQKVVSKMFENVELSDIEATNRLMISTIQSLDDLY